MDVAVVGMGCSRCDQLAANTRRALADLGLADVCIRRVEDLEQIVNSGVALPPGLVIEGHIVAMGQVLSPERIKRAIGRILTPTE
jgi:small redox-active disulfide protein 2